MLYLVDIFSMFIFEKFPQYSRRMIKNTANNYMKI